LGTVCGLVFFAVYGISGFRLHQVTAAEAYISWFRKCWLPFAAILGSAFVLVFWDSRQSDWLPVRRALSSVNAADFSWRNRIAAWEGALQITAENPLSGAGWSNPQPLYGHYYLQARLTETGAIELNDYLTLGATVGLSALFCFGMYLWLSLKSRAESGNQKAEIQDMDWLRTVCHAGAIVLLVGFWFDGGLFKLPTAATFWILLGLGSAGNREPCEHD
jgi:O-antigen ligase